MTWHFEGRENNITKLECHAIHVKRIKRDNWYDFQILTNFSQIGHFTIYRLFFVRFIYSSIN